MLLLVLFCFGGALLLKGLFAIQISDIPKWNDYFKRSWQLSIFSLLC
jgi:hypothetical protein